jgi:hypothetical protein
MPANQILQLPLRDVHLPEAINWWPLAIGWWITMLLIPILLWITFLVYKYLTRKTAIKTAIKTAKKLLAELKQDKTKTEAQILVEISALIRRVAMSIAPRGECASLTGKAWLEYLDKSVKDLAFTQGIGQCLADVTYRRVTPTHVDIGELINLTERWLTAQQRKSK